MGRGRGKGKKQSAIAGEIGEDEKLPMKRRGRPLKPVKDEIEDDFGIEKTDEYEDCEDTQRSDMNCKNEAVVENGKTSKRPCRIKESEDLVKEENCLGTKTNGTNVLIKNVGFRPIGSRRKNKPRRAAEVGVECK